MDSTYRVTVALKTFRAWALVFVGIGTLLPLVACAPPYPEGPWESYMHKQYCFRRGNPQCCPGRNDYCAVPIHDTYCYCDMFCRRTVSDCCPDFWQLCVGIEPPPGAQTFRPTPTTSTSPSAIKAKNNCFHEGVLHSPGSTINVNCNNCTCAFVDEVQGYNWNCTQKICLIRPELIDLVNSGKNGWRASNYTMFWGHTLDDGVKHRLGTLKPVQPVQQMTSLRTSLNEILPEVFDARDEWPGLIHGIQDQGNCGASWAFSTTGVAADRLSIHSQGIFHENLAPQHLVSCDQDFMQQGCDGGHVDRAWWFIRSLGIVTEDCYPYVSGKTGIPGACLVPLRHTRSARRLVSCPNYTVKSRVFQATPPYRIAPNEKEIMKEIQDNGPVQATMEVKADFYSYKSGVYHYSLPADYLPPNYSKTGYHSVKIIGWGTDYTHQKPLKYWLCANSWGTNWGDEGYFRILRGSNECNIESFVIASWGKVNGRQVTIRAPVGIHKLRKQRDLRASEHEEQTSWTSGVIQQFQKQLKTLFSW